MSRACAPSSSVKSSPNARSVAIRSSRRLRWCQSLPEGRFTQPVQQFTVPFRLRPLPPLGGLRLVSAVRRSVKTDSIRRKRTRSLPQGSGHRDLLRFLFAPLCPQKATPRAELRDPADLVNQLAFFVSAFPFVPADSLFRNASRFLPVVPVS